MNTLTQKQINQYQWQVADGVAKIHNGPVFSVDWNNKEHDLSNIEYHTNSPDGIYSGEAFEIEKQIQNRYQKNWFKDAEADNHENGRFKRRLFLRLKPSHLPAVLTTQPGEEWKDRYKGVWYVQERGNLDWTKVTRQTIYDNYNFERYAALQFDIQDQATKREWHLITPPAEQEAETVELSELEIIKSINTIVYETNLSMGYNELLYVVPYRNNDYLIIGIKGKTENKVGELMKLFNHEVKYLVESEYKLHDSPLWNEAFVGFIARTQYRHLQSTLTQKDQRIAELEREREWISVNDRLPEGQTEVLVYMPKYGSDMNVYFLTDLDLERKTWFNCFFDTKPFSDVTHWMPLPTPPQH